MKKLFPGIIISFSMLFILSCGINTCDTEDIKGVVESLTINGSTGSLLINGTNLSGLTHDYAIVSIDENTVILNAIDSDSGTEVTINALSNGQFVSACFVGEVLESYPVQATAGRIIILSNAATN